MYGPRANSLIKKKINSVSFPDGSFVRVFGNEYKKMRRTNKYQEHRVYARVASSLQEIPVIHRCYVQFAYSQV